MSSNNQARKPSKKAKDAMKKLKSLDEGKLMANLMHEMKSVDTQSRKAKSNETTMEDSEGKKIIYVLTDDMVRQKKDE